MVTLRQAGSIELDGGGGDYSTGDLAGGTPSSEYEQATVSPPPDSAFSTVEREAGVRLQQARADDGQTWWRVQREINGSWQPATFPTRDEQQVRADYAAAVAGGATDQEQKVLRQQAADRSDGEDRTGTATVDGDPRSPSGEAHAVLTGTGGGTSPAVTASAGGAGDNFGLVLLVGGAVLLATWRMMDA